MNALVIYESMFGNTQTISQAVADGLAEHMKVELAEVATAPTTIGDNIDLLIIGAPTHAFSMSRASTRQDAAKQSDHSLVSTGIGIREWLETLTCRSGISAATFDTRVNRPRLPGSAAIAAQKRLRRLGLRVIAPAQSFRVHGTAGPLIEGEPERARQFGEQLARRHGEAAGVTDRRV